MDGVPHHFVAELSPTENCFNVYQFQKLALPRVVEYRKLSHVPDTTDFGKEEAAHHCRGNKPIY